MGRPLHHQAIRGHCGRGLRLWRADRCGAGPQRPGAASLTAAWGASGASAPVPGAQRAGHGNPDQGDGLCAPPHSRAAEAEPWAGAASAAGAPVCCARLGLRLTRSPAPLPQFGNAAVLRSNVMKYFSHFFAPASLSKLFFCFPDPHFKAKNHRRRIIRLVPRARAPNPRAPRLLTRAAPAATRFSRSTRTPSASAVACTRSPTWRTCTSGWRPTASNTRCCGASAKRRWCVETGWGGGGGHGSACAGRAVTPVAAEGRSGGGRHV